MDEELSDISSIEQIDDGVIRNKWMNVMFVDFVFHFAFHVSKNKKYVMDRLVDESVTIFDVLSASDIAWAVTCYVNNKDYWDSLITTGRGSVKSKNARKSQKTPGTPKKAQAKAKEHGVTQRVTRRSKENNEEEVETPRTPRRSTRNKGEEDVESTPRRSARKEATGQKKAATPARKNPGQADVEDEDDNEEVEDAEAHTGTRWTNKHKSRLHGDGWEKEGRLFHEKVKSGLGNIQSEDWADVWKVYWEMELVKHLRKGGKKRARKALEVEDEEESLGEDDDVIFSSSSDEESEGDNSGSEGNKWGWDKHV